MPNLVNQMIDFQTNRKINWIIRSMFVDTADENYILARWAFNNDLETDFYWLSLHATEKYMKAILMLNGRSAKGFRHDIRKLYDKIHEIEPSIATGEFPYPPWISDKYLYRKENLGEFIDKLATNGNPNNRYAPSGHEIGSEDIHRLDHLIWELRRHCCNFFQKSPNDNNFTNIEILQSSSRATVFRGKVDEIIEGMDSPKKQALLIYNYAFDPNNAISPKHSRSAAGWGALYWTALTLKNKYDDPINYESSSKAIDWIIKNMPIGKEDENFINEQRAIGARETT